MSETERTRRPVPRVSSAVAAGTALAGCVGDGRGPQSGEGGDGDASGSGDGGSGDGFGSDGGDAFDGRFDDVDNYDGVVDETGTSKCVCTPRETMGTKGALVVG